MTDFYNIKDKKIQCGICNDWVDKDFFIKFENNHVLFDDQKTFVLEYKMKPNNIKGNVRR